eukprot:7864013-Ditylum_brightwellii.AAC.1
MAVTMMQRIKKVCCMHQHRIARERKVVGGVSVPFAMTHYHDGIIALQASTAAATTDDVISKTTAI